MKTHLKLLGCGSAALLAATVALQAQTTKQDQAPASGSSSASTSQPASSSNSSLASPSASSAASAPATSSSSSADAASSAQAGSSAGLSSSQPSSSSTTASGSLSGSSAASGSIGAPGSTSGSLGSGGQDTTSTSAASNTPATGQTGGATGSTSTGAQTDTSLQVGNQASTTTNVTASTEVDTQVTSVVQQIDAQGPVVVERITTQFADVTCTPDNARLLVEGLTSGGAVTLSADGKTASFTPGVRLGYGEAYIALALAAEALRNAGITGCATPEQWQAVLMGGPLVGASTTTTSTSRSAVASSSSSFPGIIALRSQGQGWGQIAQTTHVQLGQVVSSAQSSFKLEHGGEALAPTGRTSAEMKAGAHQGDHEAKPGKSDDAPHGKAWGQDKNETKASKPDKDASDASHDASTSR